MKLLLVVPTLEPGGAEHVVADLAAHLPQCGVSVTVCYLDGAGTLAARIREAGVEVIGLGLPHKAYPAVWRMAGLLRRYRPDVIHAHMPRGAFWAGMGRRVSHLRSPLVYTEHNVQPAYPRWGYGIFRYMNSCLQHVIAVSDETLRSFTERWGWPAAGASVIPNGIQLHPEVPRTRAQEGRAALGVPPGAQVICNIAHVTSRKAQDVLVAAVSRTRSECPSVCCWIAGRTDIEPAATERVLRAIEHYRVSDCVSLLGMRPDVPGLLDACDVFVLSSRQEGFPITILEAMGAGKPVVTTEVGGCAEAVVDGETGIVVPPEDPEALAKALEYVLTHPDEARRMGQAGRGRVREHFTVEAMVRKHIDVYQRVATEYGG